MSMRLSEIVKLLNAEVFAGHDKLDMYLDTACATDLMSDLLRGDVEDSLLLTGLNSVQTIKTAVISNISAVVLVRAKKPLKEVIEETEKHDLPLLSTPFTMYTACGRLFKEGIRGVDGRTKSYSKEKIQDKV